jgi:beta-glucosidase
MTESSLLRDVLRDEWDYHGLVMSDWFATRSTTASANAALELGTKWTLLPRARACRSRRRRR